MTEKYLLIGSGRVAFHLTRYFAFLNLPLETWTRSEPLSALDVKASRATHILLAISDSAIEPFLAKHRAMFERQVVVHFSGALSTPQAESAHPLMTFAAGAAYSMETYRSLPFVLESGRKTFAEILPGLPNPHFAINPGEKTLYHALCVMSGNFTTLLWQKAFAQFEEKFDLPKEILIPFLEQTVANLKANLTAPLTGPLARGDEPTIQKHLETLGSDPYAGVYRAMVKAFREENHEIGA